MTAQALSLCFCEYTTNILTSTTDLLAILFFVKYKQRYVKYFAEIFYEMFMKIDTGIAISFCQIQI